MKVFISKFLAFLQKDLKIALTYKFNILMQIFVILFIFSLFFYALNGSNFSEGGINTSRHIEFFNILIGIALIDFMFSSMSVFSREIRVAQTHGTFEALMLTNTSIFTILFSSYALTFTRSILRILIYILIGKIFFGVGISFLDIPIFFALLIYSSLPFIGIGLFAASFIILFKVGDIINFAIGFMSIFFSGIFFSIDSLPAHFEAMSNSLPLTIGLESIQKSLLSGLGFNQILSELIRIFYLIIVFLPSGIFLVYYSLKVAKKNGSLNHY